MSVNVEQAGKVLLSMEEWGGQGDRRLAHDAAPTTIRIWCSHLRAALGAEAPDPADPDQPEAERPGYELTVEGAEWTGATSEGGRRDVEVSG